MTAQQPEAQSSLDEQRQNRLEKLTALSTAGQSPFLVTRVTVDHATSDILEDFAQLEGQYVRLAGRLMSRRGMGKVSFSDLQDDRGRLQIFSKIDELGEAAYAAWQALDIGDLVAVEGEVFRTQRGEISLKNKTFTLIAKCLRPLPEKYHGLTDTDTRYRKRYLDLIVNPEVRQAFEKRSAVIRSLRSEMEERDFLEVETPILSAIAGGAAARPFLTHHNTLDLELKLRISPELFLKRLVVGGFLRVFEIGRSFRNEGMSIRHNPEFTMLEGYQAYTDYRGMMELMEALVVRAARDVAGTTKLNYQGQELDLTPPFRRASMTELVEEVTGLDFNGFDSVDQARMALAAAGLGEVSDKATVGELLADVFDERVEPALIQPVFVYGYPVEISPLAKQMADQPWLTERLELFIGGREYGNAYSELNDPLEQKKRFQDQQRRLDAGDQEANVPDEDFVEALEYGLPPTGGFGIGVDRLVMLLADAASIRDVLLFPTMKPLGGKNPENQGSEDDTDADSTKYANL